MTTAIVKRDVPGLLDVAPVPLEVGSIRVGYKRADGIPFKLESFIVCDPKGSKKRPDIRVDIMQRIATRMGVTETTEVDGLKVPCLRELDVVLMFDRAELNMYTYRGLYSASRVLCKGFGEGSDAERWDPEQRAYFPLPCLGQRCDWTFEGIQVGNGKVQCKPHGVLKVMLRDAPLLGALYILRTRSARSIGAIMGGMQMVQAFSGGRLSGLPFRLKVIPWTSKEELPNGKVETRRYPLITMAYAGDTPALMDAVTALSEKKFLHSAELRERLEQRLIAAYTRTAAAESDETDAEDLAELAESQGEPEDRRSSGAALLPPATTAPAAAVATMPASQAAATLVGIAAAAVDGLPGVAAVAENQLKRIADGTDQTLRAERLAELAALFPDKPAREALRKRVVAEGISWVRTDQASVETLDEYLRIGRTPVREPGQEG